MRIRQFIALLFIASAVLVSPCHLQAQGTADQVKKDAETYFENGDFAAAMPLYSQLLANDRNNPNYNYRYGVCVLYASSEKERGLEYLQKASKSQGVDADVWFYLGKAYHLNYQFEQAISAYTKFKTLGGAKKAEKYQVDNQIAMCKTGRKLLKAITDITVLEKAELDEADFFRHYDMRGAGYSGQLLVKPPEFQTSIDKKKKEQSIIFLSGEKNELFFSSYGEDESQGKDIYVVRKLPNGNWGKPFNLGYPINTEYDEDFPFMHPNGKVLYFSSKGHNSMGGYDIFRAEMNEETGTWQKPVNLDFAINSPDDDIMFVSDLDEKTAWFASSRSSPEGKMTVYHVVIERKPVNNCLITGTFIPTKGDENRSAKITVKNSETNEPIGVYNSNETTGAYLINLPNNGGKYSFTVDHSGIATQTNEVAVPTQYQIKALNQQIGYEDQNNESKLYIRTDFEADTSMLDPTFLKDKAKLDMGTEPTATTITDMSHTPGTLPEAGSLDSSGSNEDDSSDVVDPTVVPSSHVGVSNEELVKSANDDANATQSEATDLDDQKDRAYNYATQLNEQAKAKTQEATQAKNAADALPEGPDKIAAQQKANELIAEANSLQTQVAAATAIAKALEDDAKIKQQEADKAKEYATSLDKAVKSKDSKALDAALAKQLELQAMSDTRPESESTAKNLQTEADKKHTELDKAKTAEQDLKEEIVQNQQRIDQLRVEQAKEKDPELKKGIDAQIEGINEDIADDQKQFIAAQKKVNLLQNQSNDLDNQAKAATDVLTQSKNPAVSSATISKEEKDKLNTDALAYQKSSEEVGTSKNYAPIDGGQPTVTQPTVTQPTVTQPTVTQPTIKDSNIVVVENENPDAIYAEALQKTDTITDPIVREKAKADVYSNWAANIDDQIKEKKQEIAGTKDKDKKAELNAELKKLQTSSNEKKQDVKTSVAAADKAQKEKDALQGTQPVVSTQDQFVKQLAAADKEASVVDKENKKAEVYSNWADALDSTAVVKEQNLLKIKNKSQQEKAKQEIRDLHADADSKRNLADEAKTKAADAIAAQPTVTQPVATDVHYDVPTATTALQEQKQFVEQANQNREKKDSLTNLAATKTGDEKNKLLTQATEQQREAWENDTKAADKLGDANKNQFEKNGNQLAGFDKAAEKSSDPSVATASLLSDESKNLFEKAKQERDSAAATGNNYIKSEALQKAADNEQKALQKQQEAIALYQKSGIQPSIITQPTVTQPTVTQPTVTQPTVAQPTVTQPTVTQPTVTQPTATSEIIDPTSGQPLSTIQLNQIRSSDAFKNYSTANLEAIKSEQAANDFKLQADTYQASADSNVAKAKDLSLQAVDEKDKTKKQELLAESKKYNEIARNNLNSRDSLTELADVEAMSANANRNKANLALQGTNQSEVDKIKAVEKADQTNYAKTGVQPTVTQPTVTQPTVTQPTVTQPTVTQPTVTQPTITQPTVTQPTVTQPTVTQPTVTQPTVTQPTVTQPTATNPSSVSNRLSPGEEFVIVPKSSEKSVAPTIKLNATLPEGLVYKVQIGAFRNPISPEIYKGLSPVTAETTSSGLTRYTAGLFTKFTNADAAKVEIRGMGYRDAFVVAFYNGKRISIDEAKRLSGESGTQPMVTQPTTTQPTITQPTVTQPTVTQPETYQGSNTPQDVKLTKGLFFTVQIGVYKNPVSNARLKNLPEIVNEKTPNGFIRYSSGKYCSVETAVVAKNNAVAKGISDAFVTAYYNGTRITPSEAQNLIATGVQPCAEGQKETLPQNSGSQNSGSGSQNSGSQNSGSHETQPTVTQPTVTQPTVTQPTVTQPTVTEPTVTQPINDKSLLSTKPPVPETGLVFSVQIGAFREEVPIEIANQFLQLASKGVKNYLDTESGLTVYQIGVCTTKEEADALKTEAISKGITDSFIVAFKDGKKITMEEAMQLLGQ